MFWFLWHYIGMKGSGEKLAIGFVAGEKVMLTFRRHWIYLFPTAVVFLMGAVLMMVLILLTPTIEENSILDYEVVFVVAIAFFP